MTPNIVNPNNIPNASDAYELVNKNKELDEQLKTAKGLDKIKLSLEKVKTTIKLSKNDFKTY